MELWAQVKRPTAEIFDVVRKICPKEDIDQVHHCADTRHTKGFGPLGCHVGFYRVNGKHRWTLLCYIRVLY